MKKHNHSPDNRRWIACSIEEDHFGENRKLGKKTRKEAMTKDRSKYKITDQDKYQRGLVKEQEAKLGDQSFLEGRVVSILPQGIIVEVANQQVSCVLKGLLKKEKTQAKNLVAVGDFVLFEKIGENEGIIVYVKPRKTFLSRADNLSRRKEQLIAVNVDQVIITVSVCNPALKFPIIDRYIIATRKGGMEPLIVINKIDLLDTPSEPGSPVLEQEKTILEEAIVAYAAAGVPLICVSTVSLVGLEELIQAMRGKTSVFSGQSGVGKSSLINFVTGLNLRVGDVVERTKKGSHTTTTTQLIQLEFGGWCVDTPGIKSFGVWDLKHSEIQGFFPEIQEIGKGCKFSDCTHSHEEECAVLVALKAGELSPLRFDSYHALMQSVREEHVRR